MIAAVVTVAVIRLIGTIDWSAVWHALRHLSWWQPLLLIALLLVRQTCNSLPLSLYIARLSLYIARLSPYRAVLNDQVAFVIGTVAPSPTDLALRTAMFSSWGIPVADGVAGALLHKLTFWIARFGVPLAGLVVLAARGDELGLRLLDVASIAFAIALAVVLLLVMRSDSLARAVGRRGGMLVVRVRPVDPEAWASSCADFRAKVAARFHGGFPRALASMAGLLAVDALMLTLSLRFVGLDRIAAPAGVVVAAYAVGYPLSLFPFAGIGLLDAVVIAGITAYGGQGLEASAVAGLIVWRVFSLGGPILLGIVSITVWQRSTAGSRTELWQLIRRGGTDAH